ncbi:hypothetical protein PIB30_074636 [Stylosanthes scabra]|uniref:Uncharacterized protein n=1 Tax=Stylosanthes scabra TaxID=79078 RepID=A0ABU6VSA5_9FABA|nr:hypothetical protein [Stylosanthes scabra]
MVSGAWMLDGATKDRMYALSLASSRLKDVSNRFVFRQRLKDFKNLPLESIRQGLESTPHSKFLEPPKIESIRRITEPIRFHPVFKFNVQNALRIDSKEKEHVFQRFPKVSGGAGRANDSTYGNSGPSGVVSAVGSLFPRGTKTNVAAHGGYRVAFGSGPGYQISASSGSVGLAMITDRVSSS